MKKATIRVVAFLLCIIAIVSSLAVSTSAIAPDSRAYPAGSSAVTVVLGEKTVLMDGGPGTARETKRRLECAGLLRQGAGEVIFENSSGDAKMIELCKKLLGGAV